MPLLMRLTSRKARHKTSQQQEIRPMENQYQRRIFTALPRGRGRAISFLFQGHISPENGGASLRRRKV